MSLGEVSYSCGLCGHALNLSSSNRVVSNSSSKFHKQSRKGVLPFLSVDESRFRLIEEVKCSPYFESPVSFGFQRVRTKLLCGRCGASIGYLKEYVTSSVEQSSSETNSVGGSPGRKLYIVNIKALQPEEGSFPGGYSA
ncbi:hypothetical protein O6H91_18G008600 [Diphasiastrum complanatum]|uniref:Uncharacterized protein n=1 Tax=Diphasiastrum complanatum TaxID=34168 RepID=A0ACC2AXW9_DIPCM|nr:hypothetical protein O6H91_18G008600 [Diphasiastrum complanatum]